MTPSKRRLWRKLTRQFFADAPNTPQEHRPMPETYGPNDIGFWSAPGSLSLLDEIDKAHDSSWKIQNPQEYAIVLAYLNTPERTEGYRGWSTCRVCKCPNGSQDWFKGPFRYPQGYVHYLVEHGFKPPQHVIQEAVNG